MKRFLVLITLLLLIAPFANAAVLTFDDVGTTLSHDYIPNGYGGFDWDDMGYIHSDFHTGSGYDNGTVSGEYTAFNYFANVASISDALFTFDGAYLTAAWNTGLSIEVKGFFDGSELYSQTVVVNTDSPTWFDFNFSNIDQLSFRSFGGTNAGLNGSGVHFAMDNFTYDSAPVPEPATMILFGIGLMGLAGVSRRKK